jgi:hypothetical protein
MEDVCVLLRKCELLMLALSILLISPPAYVSDHEMEDRTCQVACAFLGLAACLTATTVGGVLVWIYVQ